MRAFITIISTRSCMLVLQSEGRVTDLRMLCGCCLILINTLREIQVPLPPLREIQVPLPPVRSSQNLYFSPTGYANYSSSVAKHSFVHVSAS